VIESNPNNTSAWLAAARVEELDGKIQAARQLMAKACERFPENEDIWFEAARLSPPEKQMSLLMIAVGKMPKSKKLWLRLARTEKDPKKKSAILQKALEEISNDVELWKEAIEIEEPAQAVVLLHKAVECVPHSVDLWLALAKLETYENARDVLNRARNAVSTEPTIWVHAAKLEEAQGNAKKVEKIISLALSNLEGVNIKRDQWLTEAVNAEKSESLVTCRALVKLTMLKGLDDEDEDEKTKK